MKYDLTSLEEAMNPQKLERRKATIQELRRRNVMDNKKVDKHIGNLNNPDKNGMLKKQFTAKQDIQKSLDNLSLKKAADRKTGEVSKGYKTNIAINNRNDNRYGKSVIRGKVEEYKRSAVDRHGLFGRSVNNYRSKSSLF